MEKLTFGEPFQNLRKGGVWYVRVTIPKEHREIYFGQGKTTKQKVYSLFSKNMHEALANLPTVKSKAIEEYRNKLKEHDPLVLSAEKLMESLFARYDENNKVLPTDKWFDVFSKNSLDYNELQGLRNYEDKKEFHRLLSLLRMEVSKLMVVHEDLRDANEFTDYEFLDQEFRKAVVKNNFTEDMAEALWDRFGTDQANYNMGGEVYANYEKFINKEPPFSQPIGTTKELGEWEKAFRREFIKAKRIVDHRDRMVAVSTLEWTLPKERPIQFQSGNKSFGLSEQQKKSVLDVYDMIVKDYNQKKYDQVSDANATFEEEVSKKVSGIRTSGIKFKQAMDLYEKSPRNKTKRLKTIGQYKQSQQLFLDQFGDLDIALITNDHAEQFVDYLIKDYKKNDGQQLTQRSVKSKVNHVASLFNWARAERIITDLKWQELEKDNPDLYKGLKGKVNVGSYSNEQLKDLFIFLKQWQIETKKDLKELQSETKNTNFRSNKEEAKLRKRIETKKAIIIDNDMITLIFQMLATSGSRLEEIIGLQWGDLRIHNDVLCYDFNRINMVLKETPSTKYARRRTPIIDAIKPYIDEYKLNFNNGNPENDTPLFSHAFGKPDADGKYSKNASKILGNWLKKVPSIIRDRENAVYNLNTHSLRHTFKSILESLNWNSTLINKLTGSGLKGMEVHYQWEEPRNFNKLLSDLNQINFNYINGRNNEIWLRKSIN